MKKITTLIKYYYKEYLRLPIRNFTIGMSNLRRWLPIVWKDRDWDKHYIMEPLLFKLRNHIEYMKHHSHVECAPEQVRTMSECLELLEKVHDEWTYYEDPACLKHEEKWGKSEFYTVPCEDRPGSWRLMDRNEERYTEEELKQKNKEYILNIRIAQNKRQRDFEVAMEIFVQNFDKWWD